MMEDLIKEESKPLSRINMMQSLLTVCHHWE